MTLTPAEYLEAALAVNMHPFTNNAVLAAKLRAEADRVQARDGDRLVKTESPSWVRTTP